MSKSTSKLSGEGVTATEGKQSAKTGRTGFLHLPSELRNRIYEDVIFDEDRHVVLYPRKLPRKVTANAERLMDIFVGNAHFSGSHISLVSFAFDNCHWEDSERPPEEVPLPIFTEELTDDESECEENVVTEPSIPLYGWTSEQRSFMATKVAAADSEAVLKSADAFLQWELFKQDDEPGGVDEDGFLIPPKKCLKGYHDEIGNQVGNNCRFCAGYGLGPDQEETAYINAENEPYEIEDPLEEDDEHFDSEERQGMLFRPAEPALFLACKEIRDQCLPIHYGSNAFSWRFAWLNQTRSLARFTEWTRVVGELAKHITQLSFEGRHSVEEGIEFEVDIDLMEEFPYFNVKVECLHSGDELTDAIVEAVEQDFIAVLWGMSRRDGGEVTFCSDDLCLLNTVFSEAMQRDPGQAGDRGQWDGKLGGVPRNT